MISKYPPDHLTAQKKPFWNNMRRIPEPIKISTVLEDNLNYVFIESTSKLLSHFFKFKIPTEDIVKDIITNKISNQVNSIDEVSVEVNPKEFLKNVQHIQQKFEKFNKVPSINLQRIKIKDSKNNSYYNDILNFIFSATNIRCLNFGLDPIKKYKVEQIAFRITPNLDILNSISASLMTIDLVKYCVVKFFL